MDGRADHLDRAGLRMVHGYNHFVRQYLRLVEDLRPVQYRRGGHVRFVQQVEPLLRRLREERLGQERARLLPELSPPVRIVPSRRSTSGAGDGRREACSGRSWSSC